MKKTFQLCHDCRMIGVEVDQVLTIDSKYKTCHSCNRYDECVPTKPVELDAERVEKGSPKGRFNLYRVVKDHHNPPMKEFREQIAAVLDE